MNRAELRSFLEGVFSCAPHGQYGYLEHSVEHARRVADYQRQLVEEGKRSLDGMLDRQVPDRKEAK